MEQITVPQFIDNEDKIMGPITVRQFIIMLIAGIILFISYKITDLSLFIVTLILVGGGAGILAFYKVNGQPFHFFILHIAQTVKNPSVRVWKKDPKYSFLPAREEERDESETVQRPHVRLTEHRLSELTLIADTGGAYHGDRDGGTELFS